MQGKFGLTNVPLRYKILNNVKTQLWTLQISSQCEHNHYIKVPSWRTLFSHCFFPFHSGTWYFKKNNGRSLVALTKLKHETLSLKPVNCKGKVQPYVFLFETPEQTICSHSQRQRINKTLTRDRTQHDTLKLKTLISKSIP